MLKLPGLLLCLLIIGLPLPGHAQTKPTPAAHATCTIGAAVEIEWNGTWWSGRILQGPDAEGQCFITYDEWAADWDEWVGPDRIRATVAQPVPATCAIGAAAQVEWNGTWWAARILQGPDAEGRCYITYDEWSADWDEWVGQDRIRAN